MAPVNSGGGQLVSGPLETAIVKNFGSFDEFKKIFNLKILAIQGSGWGWVVRSFFWFSYDKSDSLCIWVRHMTSFRGISKL